MYSHFSRFSRSSGKYFSLTQLLIYFSFNTPGEIRTEQMCGSHVKVTEKQECIPVGCVPAARWPYTGVCFPGGGLLPAGLLSPGGVLSPGGCLLRGVSAPGGVCSQGGCLLRGGVCSGGVVCSGGIPACTEADTPPPCGQTHACKNITLAQLRCGR